MIISSKVVIATIKRKEILKNMVVIFKNAKRILQLSSILNVCVMQYGKI